MPPLKWGHNKNHPVNKGHASVILFWLNKTLKPKNKDHLSIKTMCCLNSLGWPFIHRFDYICVSWIVVWHTIHTKDTFYKLLLYHCKQNKMLYNNLFLLFFLNFTYFVTRMHPTKINNNSLVWYLNNYTCIIMKKFIILQFSRCVNFYILLIKNV